MEYKTPTKLKDIYGCAFISRTPSDFSILLSLVPVVKILKKNWGHRKNLGESEGQTFKISDREKCQF